MDYIDYDISNNYYVKNMVNFYKHLIHLQGLKVVKELFNNVIPSYEEDIINFIK